MMLHSSGPAGDPIRLVLPFRGERFEAAEALSRLISPPYDVIGQAEREELASRSAHNIVRLILPRGADSRYASAAASLAAWRTSGVLGRAREPGVTVVRQSFQLQDGTTRHRTGVIGAVAVEPFRAGRVKPHERTHAGPKADRLALLRATRTVFDALLMLARDESAELRQLLAEVTASPSPQSAELDGVVIDLWTIAGDEGQAIAEAAGAGSLYIADGHHRYETAIAFAEESPSADRTLALIVPLGDPGLVVLPTHRVIHGERVEQQALLGHLQERFQVRELLPEEDFVKPLEGMRTRGTACALVLPGVVYLLLLKSDAAPGERLIGEHPTVSNLDVARVDALVVRSVQGAAGGDSRVSYTADPGAVRQQVDDGVAVAGVTLNPPHVEEVLAVADAGATMPQKSTYFTPKVPSGLVLLPVG